jgi:hypothetical protein
LITLLIASLRKIAATAQVQNGSDIVGVYDNFNSKWLDPTKWTTGPKLLGRGRTLECVREVQSGQLRLSVRELRRNELGQRCPVCRIRSRMQYCSSVSLHHCDRNASQCHRRNTSYRPVRWHGGNYTWWRALQHRDTGLGSIRSA